MQPDDLRASLTSFQSAPAMATPVMAGGMNPYASLSQFQNPMMMSYQDPMAMSWQSQMVNPFQLAMAQQQMMMNSSNQSNFYNPQQSQQVATPVQMPPYPANQNQNQMGQQSQPNGGYYNNFAQFQANAQPGYQTPQPQQHMAPTAPYTPTQAPTTSKSQPSQPSQIQKPDMGSAF